MEEALSMMHIKGKVLRFIRLLKLCLAVKFHLANGSGAHLFSFNVIHACAVIVCSAARTLLTTGRRAAWRRRGCRMGAFRRRERRKDSLKINQRCIFFSQLSSYVVSGGAPPPRHGRRRVVLFAFARPTRLAPAAWRSVRESNFRERAGTFAQLHVNS